MRHDTFTIHAVGDYTSVETQETPKKMQRHVTVYALMPMIPAPVHDSCAYCPVPRNGPFLQTGPFLVTCRSMLHVAQVMCCKVQILVCAP